VGPFPQLRLVGLAECGTHALVDAAMGLRSTADASDTAAMGEFEGGTGQQPWPGGRPTCRPSARARSARPTARTTPGGGVDAGKARCRGGGQCACQPGYEADGDHRRDRRVARVGVDWLVHRFSWAAWAVHTYLSLVGPEGG
jgi:hypothetical protein